MINLHTTPFIKGDVRREFSLGLFPYFVKAEKAFSLQLTLLLGYYFLCTGIVTCWSDTCVHFRNTKAGVSIDLK